MTKKKSNVLKVNVKSNHDKCTPSQQKIREYNAIKPFLHEVNKIVKEECAKHKSVEDFPWYSIWKTWDKKDLFEFTTINVIGRIVCPELRYKERTIKNLAQRILSDITPVSSYIQVNELSDTSIRWESLVKVDSFKSLKVKRNKKSKVKRIVGKILHIHLGLTHPHIHKMTLLFRRLIRRKHQQ